MRECIGPAGRKKGGEILIAIIRCVASRIARGGDIAAISDRVIAKMTVFSQDRICQDLRDSPPLMGGARGG